MAPLHILRELDDVRARLDAIYLGVLRDLEAALNPSLLDELEAMQEHFVRVAQ